jgi:hypothetical protein
MATCVFIKRNGERCAAGVRSEGDLCVWHDPERREVAMAARRAGAATTNARNSRVRTFDEDDAPGPPETIEDAVSFASRAAWGVATGKIDARTTHEIGYVLRAFLDGQKHLDRVDARVKELEAKLAKLREAAG